MRHILLFYATTAQQAILVLHLDFHGFINYLTRKRIIIENRAASRTLKVFNSCLTLTMNYWSTRVLHVSNKRRTYETEIDSNLNIQEISKLLKWEFCCLLMPTWFANAPLTKKFRLSHTISSPAVIYQTTRRAPGDNFWASWLSNVIISWWKFDGEPVTASIFTIVDLLINWQHYYKIDDALKEWLIMMKQRNSQITWHNFEEIMPKMLPDAI